MQYIYNGWNNLPRFVALSAILHVLIISAAAYFASITPLRKYITPVYTVDLLGPIAEKPKEADAIKSVQESKPLPIEEPKPLVKPVEKKAEEPKTAKVEKAIPLKKEREEKVDVDITVNRLKEKVKKEEAEEAQIKKRIEEFETNTKIQKRIDELEKEIKKSESAAKKMVNIEVKSSVRGVEPASKITGEITQELINLESNAYSLKLRENIYSHWIFPNDSKRDLIAIISIKISRAGNLTEKWFEKSSGNPAYDNSAMRAIEKAAPFPPPPDVLFENNFVEAEIRFCPYGCPKED